MLSLLSQLANILLLSLVALLSGNNEAQLTFVGDAMQHVPQINAATTSSGGYDYSPCFRFLDADIAGADFAVANLEVTLGGKPYTGFPTFSAPDEYGQALKTAGFDLLQTVNNHCIDRGPAGLKRTIATLDAMGMPHIGTYVDQAARNEQVPYITTVKGIKIAFLAYTYGTNGIPVTGGVVVNHIDRNHMKADIDLARKRGAQVICCCLHWGIEYTMTPIKEQRDIADFLVEEGVDLIIGGHPHVVEPMEVRHSKRFDKDVLLVYSLGNFISNQKDIDSRGGAMVKVNISMVGDTPMISQPRYKLFFVQKPSYRGENYVLIPENRPDLLRADSKREFESFMSRAHKYAMDKNIGVEQEN